MTTPQQLHEAPSETNSASLPSYQASPALSPLNPRRASTLTATMNGEAERRSSNGLVTTTSDGLSSITLAVAQGTVGGSFGPFPRSSAYCDGRAPFLHRDSRASSTSLLDLRSTSTILTPPYRLNSAYSSSGESLHEAALPVTSYTPRETSRLFAEQDESLLWTDENKEADDHLHDWSKADDEQYDKQVRALSSRGLLDAGLLCIIVIGIVGVFAGWPIWRYAITGRFPNHINAGGRSDIGGWGLGGTNGSSQIPLIPGLPTLIDQDTPLDARTIVIDGEKLSLVFSDEFNADGRTFVTGDDPYWEAIDLHYWATADLEWYDPDAVVTKGGNLEITLSQEPSHRLNFRSGMLQSWNKFCFTGGAIEARFSLPGTPYAMGAWPAVWTLGNLGRAGYGATNHGVWPFSYSSCDVGTLPNQVWANGTGPAAALHSGDKDYGGALSHSPGQRLSACTCPGEDHPGPNVNVGRGAPEIDVMEGQVSWINEASIGSTSQSLQIQPSDAGYHWRNTTPHTTLFNTAITTQNIWQGSVNQESASVITTTDTTSYEGAGYLTQGFYYEPGDKGRILWNVNGVPTWQILASAFPPDPDTQISQRLISEEPMSINLNLAISNAFQPPQWSKLQFPMTLRIDYIRVYQKGDPRVSCDPPSHPTSDYVNRHLDAYMNPNLTTWSEASGLVWPKNRLGEGGCA